MALRLACNLAAIEEGARALVGSEEDAAVTVEAIAKGLAYSQPGVQNAAAGIMSIRLYVLCNPASLHSLTSFLLLAALAFNVTSAYQRHDGRVAVAGDATLRLTHVLSEAITEHLPQYLADDAKEKRASIGQAATGPCVIGALLCLVAADQQAARVSGC